MKQKNKVFSGKFILGMILYACLFLVIAGAGLGIFWKFIEAYELSRPKNTVKAYMEQLTVDQMCDGSDDLYNLVDHNLQTRDQFDQVIRSSVSGDFSYAKKSSESTEDRQVFVVRSGKTPVGTFAIRAGEEDKFGFRRWEVESCSFDFSHLMGEGMQLTVPAEYTVQANGVTLDESYITETDIQYSALAEFYDSHPLPTMVTYAVHGYLGEIALTAMDASGNPVIITADMDMNALLPQCSGEEAGKVKEFVENFVDLWVKFSGSNKSNKGGNYHRLKKVLSSDGALAERLYSALDGLTFGQSNGSKIMEIPINRIVPLGDGNYICDITYVVQTNGRQGAVETTSNMKLFLVTEKDELKLKTMERY